MRRDVKIGAEGLATIADVSAMFIYLCNMMSSSMFKLDRTIGKGHSHKEAADQSAYWRSKTVEERLSASMYLNSIAYNFDINNPPRLDKAVFRTRKHKDI